MFLAWFSTSLVDAVNPRVASAPSGPSAFLSSNQRESERNLLLACNGQKGPDALRFRSEEEELLTEVLFVHRFEDLRDRFRTGQRNFGPGSTRRETEKEMILRDASAPVTDRGSARRRLSDAEIKFEGKVMLSTRETGLARAVDEISTN